MCQDGFGRRVAIGRVERASTYFRQREQNRRRRKGSRHLSAVAVTAEHEVDSLTAWPAAVIGKPGPWQGGLRFVGQLEWRREWSSDGWPASGSRRRQPNRCCRADGRAGLRRKVNRLIEVRGDQVARPCHDAEDGVKSLHSSPVRMSAHWLAVRVKMRGMRFSLHGGDEIAVMKTASGFSD